MSVLTRLIGAFRRFTHRQDGTASVEAVLWFPMFGLISGLLVDASVVFHGQAEVTRVVQDANRNISIGRFTTEAEVESFISSQLKNLGVNPKTVDAQLDPNENFIYTSVVVPAKSLQLIGYFSGLMNLDLEINAVHLLESWDPDTFTTGGLVSTI